MIYLSNATANSKQVIDATGVVDVFDVGNKPSCITFYGAGCG